MRFCRSRDGRKVVRKIDLNTDNVAISLENIDISLIITFQILAREFSLRDDQLTGGN